jgi:putative FmdB family regulatory protein
MPIYEYACKDCGHTFDTLQKMGAEPLVECPECGKPELRKMVSAPNFRLKGSGWYETDFKKDNRRNVVDGPDKKDGPAKKDDGAAKKDPADKGKTDKAAKSTADKKSGGDKPAGGKSGKL